MSRTATQAVAQPKVQPKATPRPAASAKGNTELSREAIADHIAAFRKSGGRIEILGITPLRVSVPPASRTKTATQPKATDKKA